MQLSPSDDPRPPAQASPQTDDDDDTPPIKAVLSTAQGGSWGHSSARAVPGQMVKRSLLVIRIALFLVIDDSSCVCTHCPL
mmetsp:Transcript_13464/g.20124  ORF Transcript_13464/g.20124 Transcript_13464/m.20124 type:complete len:81 (-) Transcript_13464:106-348(-)